MPSLFNKYAMILSNLRYLVALFSLLVLLMNIVLLTGFFKYLSINLTSQGNCQIQITENINPALRVKDNTDKLSDHRHIIDDMHNEQQIQQFEKEKKEVIKPLTDISKTKQSTKLVQPTLQPRNFVSDSKVKVNANSNAPIKSQYLEKQSTLRSYSPTSKDLFQIYFTHGVSVDWYKDVKINRTLYNLKWHPLFPNFPVKTTTMKKLADESWVGGPYARRIYGFIVVNNSSMFEIELSSRDGLEILILETGILKDKFEIYDLRRRNFTKVLQENFAIQEIIKQDKTIRNSQLFKKYQKVFLKKNRLYLIEILQGGTNYGKMEIKWRSNVNQKFDIINEKYLYTILQQNINVTTKESFFQKIEPLYTVTNEENIRLQFHELLLFSPNYTKLNKSCKEFSRPKIKLKKDYGTLNVDRVVVYPKELFNYSYNVFSQSQLVIDEKEVQQLTNKVLMAINAIHKE